MFATSTKVHVVIGLGNVGREVAQQLLDEGLSVTILTRNAPDVAVLGANHVTGSLSDLRGLWRSIPRADVLYNCANPPYARWSREWPQLTRAANAFAQSTGAVLATVSNLYGYGAARSPLKEDLALRATFRNGIARAGSWTDTMHLHRKGLVRAVEVRAADFICAGDQSRMGDRVVPRVLAGKPVQLLGNVATEHSWAFPVDVARSLIAVANDNRGHGRAWHVPVNPPRTQADVVNDIAKVAGVARVKVSTVPRAARNLVSMFNPVVRELRDTDFQFAQPFIVDDSAIRSAFGIEPTPWSDGLRDLVAHYEPRGK